MAVTEEASSEDAPWEPASRVNFPLIPRPGKSCHAEWEVGNLCQPAVDRGSGGPQGRCRRTKAFLQEGTADPSDTALTALISSTLLLLMLVISITKWIHSSSASFSVYV